MRRLGADALGVVTKVIVKEEKFTDRAVDQGCQLGCLQRLDIRFH